MGNLIGGVYGVCIHLKTKKLMRQLDHHPGELGRKGQNLKKKKIHRTVYLSIEASI